MRLSDNIRGALLMAGSMTAFTINDAFMKVVLLDVPLFQALFLRSIGVVICLAVLCKILGQLRFDLPRREWVLMILRAVAEGCGAFFFLSALARMPIANVSAILQALPLTVSLGGALFLGAALGWRRLVAILIGFCGVLLIVQPGGADFNAASLYAVAAVIVVTFRDLIVRRMSPDTPSVMVALVAAVIVLALSGIGASFVTWVSLGSAATFGLLGATFFVLGGYVFSVATMRVGEISFIAPFRYTSLLVALILGAVVFGEFPDATTLIGAAIVVAMGLFTLYREAKLKARNLMIAGRLR